MARSILVGALACLALILAPTADAQAPSRNFQKKEYPIDVAQQPVTPALEKLSEQTGIYYGYSPATPEEEQIIVGPVRGKYTIEEALRRLLRPTGLTFSWINSRTISIQRPPPPPPKVETPPQAKRPRNVQTVRKAVPRAQPADTDVLDEVTTYASRVRSLGDQATAIILLDREEIDRSGVSTIFDLVRLLPQQPFLRPDGFRSNGAQYVELRGLGPDTTMVLINGRRAFASAASFTANAFDLNTIPLSAVERVEVLLDSTSVKYGTDAIGGIVNIVLRDEVPHPSADVYYGGSHGGGEQLTASVRLGHKGDDAKAAVILDYSAVQTLLGAERDLWANQDYRRFGGVDQRLNSSSPGNVTSFLPGNLPGLAAPFAAIPERIAGDRIAPSEFLPGQRNYESLLQYFPIVPATRRASVVASAQAHLTDELDVSAELMYVDRSVRFPLAPPLLPGVPVLANPFNPFGVPVVVNTLLEGIGQQEQNVESTLARGVGSVHGKARTWDWEVSLLRSEEDAGQWTDNLLDFPRVLRALNNPDPNQALDVFRPGPAASPEVLHSLIAARRVENLATDASQAGGFVSGSVFELPAGPLTAILGGEWRKESVQFDATLDSFGREVGAGFAELTVPVLGERNLSVPRKLQLTIAGRFDDYTDFGEFLNPQYGLVWRPYRDLSVRAAYARSFRPPSMFELYFPKRVIPNAQAVLDLRRDRETTVVALATGGNPDLEPTRGESYTAGLEFRPQAVEPLKLSAAYWRIAVDKRVTPVLQSSFVLANESLFPERVIRAEPTPADVAAGRPGRILQVDVSRMNFGELTTSGIDLAASYTLDSALGRFGANLMVTWIDKFETVDVQPTAASRINLANDTIGTITKWRGVATVDWRRGALATTTRVRYIPAYDDTLGGVRNGRTIPQQTFLDLQLSMDFEELADGALWRGLELAVGAANVLDEHPHFAEVGGLQGYDISQGDLRGRFWYLRLGKTF